MSCSHASDFFYILSTQCTGSERRELSDVELEGVQEALADEGEVVTVRFVDTQVLLTFAKSSQALRAARRSKLKVTKKIVVGIFLCPL